MFAKEEGVPLDQTALAARVRSAVGEIARKQAEVGIDVLNDGEVSKPGYANYVKDRRALRLRLPPSEHRRRQRRNTIRASRVRRRGLGGSSLAAPWEGKNAARGMEGAM